MSEFRLLDRLDRMQSRPVGSLNSTPMGGGGGGSLMSAPSAAAQQYHRQTEAYGSALRLLRRASRTARTPEGRAEAALKMIDVRDKMAETPFSAGGIRRHEDYVQGALGYEQALGEKTDRMEEVLGRQPVDPLQGMADQLTRQSPFTQEKRFPDSTPPITRDAAALDILAPNGRPDALPSAQNQRGYENARMLGATDEQIQKFIARTSGNPLLRNQILDRSLGAAKTPEEVNGLRDRARSFGISDNAFNRRTSWWNQKRSL